MFTWKKKGRVFDPMAVEGRPWLKEFAQAPATLVFDDFVRIYFGCRPPRDPETGQYMSYQAYVDVERKNLLNILAFAEKPVIELGGPGAFDEFGIYPFSPVHTENGILAYYAGWTRCVSVPFTVQIGRAFSIDNGKTFQKPGLGGPALPLSADEPFIISGPKLRRFNNIWYLFYIAGKKWLLDEGRPEPVYRIRMAVSEDGMNWKKQNRDIIPVVLEADEAQASPDVIFWNGRYHMFFCYRYSTNYRLNDRGYRIGYAWSDDLMTWHRDDAQAGIGISTEKNGFDDESIAYPHVFELDGKLHMLYLGNQVGRFGFGLATLEPDKEQT